MPQHQLLVIIATFGCLACGGACQTKTDASRNSVGVTTGGERNAVPRIAVRGPTKMATSDAMEQLRRRLVELIVDVEHGGILTKKDVVSRLGKPDSSQETGSKKYTDRVILTICRYDLSTGDYDLPAAPRLTVGLGCRAKLVFDDREQVHDPRGRLVSTPGDFAPLVEIQFMDQGHILLRDSRGAPLVFPTGRRSIYGKPESTGKGE